MELILIAAVPIVVLLAAVTVLLVRSTSAIRATREALATHGVPVGPESAYAGAVAAGRTTGTRVAVALGLFVLAAFLVSAAISFGLEPTALELFAPAGMVIALPTLLVLGMLAVTWIAVCTVRALHAWLPSADLGGAPEQTREEGVRLLRRVTWSQAGVTGVGVVAGLLSVLFGAGLVAVLFALASTAIACARDPKCI